MTHFTDTQNRRWLTDVTLATVARVRKLTGYNLLDLCQPDSQIQKDLTDNPVVFLDVLGAVLQPQLQGQDITVDDLAEAIDEEVGTAAADALLKGIMSFFTGRKRDALLAAHDKMKKVQDRLEAQALTSLEQAVNDPALEAEIESSMRRMNSKPKSGDALESSGSIQPA